MSFRKVNQNQKNISHNKANLGPPKKPSLEGFSYIGPTEEAFCVPQPASPSLPWPNSTSRKPAVGGWLEMVKGWFLVDVAWDWVKFMWIFLDLLWIFVEGKYLGIGWDWDGVSDISSM